MYLEKGEIHISVDELKNRKYDMNDLLYNTDVVGRQVICQINIEMACGFKYKKVLGLLEGELIIQVF